MRNEVNRQVVLAATRITRKLMQAPAMDAFRGAELAPGDAVQSDEEVLDWVMSTAETTYHPVGTCKMGGGEDAVVDKMLRVHGVEGLRVIDASIMPTITSGNTNAPSIMIGEKGADLLLQDHAA